MGRHHAAIAESPQVLRREEAEAAEMAERSSGLALELCADGLGCVLDHNQVVPQRDIHDAVHIGHLPIQVHGDDGLRLFSDSCFDQGRVDVVSGRIDVGEDRRRAEPVDATGRRKEAVRRRDDLVAGPDAGCHQRDEQRIGARGHADAERCSRVARHFMFQRLDLRSADEVLAVAYAIHRRAYFFTNRRILRLQVQ